MSVLLDSSTPLKLAHKRSIFHRKEIEHSVVCGCFNCLEVFSPVLIKRWTDNGQTAICPYCGVDSVIGDKSTYPITGTFLQDMHNHYFRQGTNGNGERVVI